MSLLLAVKNKTKYLPYFGDCVAMFWIKDLWEFLRQASEHFFLFIPNHACPIVQSTWRPSAFRFSHTLKLTPQLLMASMVFCMFVYFLADGALFRLYFLSFSIASLRIFFSNLSVKRQKTTPLFSMFKVFSKH